MPVPPRPPLARGQGKRGMGGRLRPISAHLVTREHFQTGCDSNERAMPPKDLYAILGIKKNASPPEIKKAYRKIARETHPDVKPGDPAAEKRFKEATAAFEVLSNDEKRKLYDEFGEDALRMGFDPKQARAYKTWRQSPGARGGGFEGFDTGDLGGFGFGGKETAGGFDLGEILGDLFGQGRRAGKRGPFGGFTSEPPRRRGGDAETSIRISLREAVLGGSRQISVEKPRTCGACNGTGRSGKAPCGACGGSGTRVGQSRLKVKIPPGVTDGQRIRLGGQGLPGTGGATPGDLLVKVEIEPHPLLRREGHDLYLELPVTVAEALYGATVEVPTFQGGLKVKVPPGSQSGRKLRLKGRGLPRAKGPAGDLYLVLSIRLPTDSKEDEDLRRATETIEARYKSSPRAAIDL